MDSVGIKYHCVVLLLILIALTIAVPAQTDSVLIVGTVLDPIRKAVIAARIHVQADSGAEFAATLEATAALVFSYPHRAHILCLSRLLALRL